VTLTFRVEAPIFVTREMLRHRLSSFNEESGRYRELDGVFYVPRPGRPLVQVGKVGEYRFKPGTRDQGRLTRGLIRIASAVSWSIYRRLLRLGIAREVARLVLPVNLYSTIYYTANLRSLLNFLSLRADWGDAAVNRSKPQDEIQQVAVLIAAYVQHHYPTVWAAFVAKGYQAV
jgi:thymidylate synthase (FAD)